MRCEFQKQQLGCLSCVRYADADFLKVHARVQPSIIPAGNLLFLRVWTDQERQHCYFHQPTSHKWSQSDTLVESKPVLVLLFLFVMSVEKVMEKLE